MAVVSEATHFHMTFEGQTASWLFVHTTEAEAKAQQRRSFQGLPLRARSRFRVQRCDDAKCPPLMERIDRETNGPLFR